VAFRRVRRAGGLEFESQLVVARSNRGVGFDVEELAADVIVDVSQCAVLDEQRVAAAGGALAEKDTLRPFFRNVDARGDAVRAVEYAWSGEERDRLRPGIQHVPVTYRRCQRLSTIALASPLPSTGITSYFPASTYHRPIISISFSRFSDARLWFSAKSSAT